MTPEEVRGIAEPIVHSVLGYGSVQEIIVSEDEDWSGDPALSVDVFVAPDKLPAGPDAYLDIRRSLSRALDAGGERRFAFLRLRDRAGETEDNGASSRPDA